MGLDVYQVTRDITCLQAPSATAPYLSLWARVRGFSPDALMRELYHSRRLVKIKCMRGDLFIVPLDLVEAAIVATRDQFANNDLAKIYHAMARTVQKPTGEANPFEASESELEEHTKSIIGLLERECLTIEQLKKKLATRVNVSYIIYALCDSHILIRGPTVRWDNNKHHYTAWRNWLPGLTIRMTKEEAQTVLIMNYIKTYGPVSLEDIVWWTGFTREDTVKKLKELADQTVEVSIDCFEGKFILAKDHLPRLKLVKFLDEPLVNFLPSQDNYIVAYRKRSRHSLRDIYHKIHDRAGNVLPVVLVDGQVEGTWDHVNGKVEHTLFEKLDSGADYAVKLKAKSLGDFLKAHL